MSTVRVTLEAAGDLPEPVREALQTLITAATAGGMGVEFSHKPSRRAVELGGHGCGGGMVSAADMSVTTINFPEASTADRVKAHKSMQAALTYTGR